jgi:hypothetical protein
MMLDLAQDTVFEYRAFTDTVYLAKHIGGVVFAVVVIHPGYRDGYPDTIITTYFTLPGFYKAYPGNWTVARS